MIVLVGQTGQLALCAKLRSLGWGRLSTRDTPNPWPGEPWGFDSGIYADWFAGRPFDESNFLRRVEVAHKVGFPYMAVPPDKVGKGLESLDYTLEWLERLPRWPWWLALQDGMTEEMVRPEAHRFAGLFLGGTDRFKSTARGWVDFAHSLGMPLHYGRAGTPRKLEWAEMCGADSCDSSFPLWTRDRMEWFIECWTHKPQMQLWSGG